mmetsp:Transcript_8480/g.12974  ORF Transcript_8480/g.12974 Transcript_8480/m.12974 type:complete len:81 (+) Transcript_8480:905-1147(+)
MGFRNPRTNSYFEGGNFGGSRNFDGKIIKSQNSKRLSDSIPSTQPNSKIIISREFKTLSAATNNQGHMRNSSSRFRYSMD